MSSGSSLSGSVSTLAESTLTESTLADEAPTPEQLTGWGRTAPSASTVLDGWDPERWAEVLAAAGPRGVIARGLGRSYGDAAQNAGGMVLSATPPSIHVDRERRVARASAGTSLHDLMVHLLPLGWFVPVTPGTRQVTVGGAIASDIHGKNHHVHGTFGSHVTWFDLAGADGVVRRVTRASDPDLFWATVGGMGLTGVILEAEFELLAVESSWMTVDTTRIGSLADLMDAMVAADHTSTYSVAWIDLMARGRQLGRSVLTVGEHATRPELRGRAARHPQAIPGDSLLSAPPIVPPHLISGPTVRAFNEVWFRKAPRRRVGEVQSIPTFFHPLDGVANWNRLYGPAGLVQYQFVIPDGAEAAVVDSVRRIAEGGHASFLAVLKRFGPANDGLLSFPLKGWTLALDLPTDPRLHTLFGELDALVADAGGRLYLAKDSRMTPSLLERTYLRLDEFRSLRARLDPSGVFTSDLARRLSL